MAVSYDPTQDVKKLTANQRALIQQKGDSLMSDQAGEVSGNEALRNDYRATLDRQYADAAEGNGGYSPEEAAAIKAQGGMPTALTDEQAQGNFLTPEEQAGIRGDTGSYTRDFNPDQMSQDQNVSAGQQRGAVNNLKTGLHGAIDNTALSQSGKFQQDSENQLGANQNEFGTVLGAVGNNVRGTIDPNAVTASDSFLKDYNMSPEEQQNIVTGAGISAGARDAAAVDDMERRAAAAGSGPGGVAAYRARMARAGAADAGDAMTQARIKASDAAAAREMSGEQLREQGGQYLTNVRSGTELKMGEDALAGSQHLGDQALTQRNSVEGQRLAAEQAKTGINVGAEEAAGAADIGTEANINAQGRQQQQFNTTTGTGIAEAQDQANVAREGALAGNRQQTGTANQATQFGQQKTVNDTGSARATGVADTRLAQQTQARNYYQGQDQQANQNAENAQNRQVQTYGTQAAGTNTAAAQEADAAKQPGMFSKIVGGVTGLIGAAGGAATGLAAAKKAFSADGGIIDKPTLAVVGEDGPEMIVPLGYRARAKVRPSQAMASERVRNPYRAVA